jgi:hypothetical protein
MAQVAMIAGLGMMCLSFSVGAALMMGGGEEDGGAGGAGGAGGTDNQDDDTFTVPTDNTSKAECYASRYPDLRIAYDTDAAGLENHWNDHGSKGENRINSCELSDDEAQAYINRYEAVKTYAGTNLDKARKYYYETGMGLHHDFAIPPAKKELECYLQKNTDISGYTLTQGLVHWQNHGKNEGRNYDCN